MNKILALALVAIFAMFFGCSSTGGARTATATLPDGFVISAEIASTPSERAAGLMYRTELCENCGMLFVFGDEGNYPFWMKNTEIPLDVIYVDGQFVIVDIWGNAQPCKTEVCQSYPPKANAKYVLEVNAGVAEKHGIREGTKMSLLFDSN
ncbi:MAG: DUF192 domain-containing protein [Candidatus Micrarchaeota archaeon]|nr:DUF192 domain-containing protein [Candidatus Micrarchaeota archaeon]